MPLVPLRAGSCRSAGNYVCRIEHAECPRVPHKWHTSGAHGCRSMLPGHPTCDSRRAAPGVLALAKTPCVVRVLLRDVHPRDGSRDDEPLNLRGALKNCVDLRVAMP